ncbi:MAG: DUF3352 domain-containing protein [bacterium]
MKRLSITISVSVLFVLLAVGGLWMLFEDLPVLGAFPLTHLNIRNKSIVEVIPQDSALVVAADLRNLDLGSFQKLLETLPTYSMISSLAGGFLQQRNNIIDIQKDVLPWIGKDVGVTVLDLQGDPTETALLLETTNIPRTRRFLERFLANIGAKFTEKTIGSYTVTQIEVNDNMPTGVEGDLAAEALADQKPLQINIALVQNFLVLTLGENNNPMQKIIATVDGQSPSIAPDLLKGDSSSAGRFYFRSPNQSDEETLVDHISGSLTAKNNVITLSYAIQGNKQHLQSKNLQLAGSGESFSPSLLAALPDEALTGTYLLPAINAMLSNSLQPISLPFAQPRDQFVFNTKQTLHLSPEDFQLLGGKETVLVTAANSFGFVSKISSVTTAQLAVKKIEDVMAQGVDFDHFLKPPHKGKINTIAYQLFQATTEGYSYTVTKDHYAWNLNEFSDEESAVPLITAKAATGEGELDWSPSWGIIDATFVWFSSQSGMESYLQKKKATNLASNEQLTSLIAKTPSVLALAHLKGKEFQKSSLSKGLELDTGIHFGYDMVDSVIREALTNAKESYLLLTGDPTTSLQETLVLVVE